MLLFVGADTIHSQTYCTPSFDDPSQHHISRVQLNTIDNTSTYASVSNSYSDFTAISTDLTLGSTYTLTIHTYRFHSWRRAGYGVWIDYNNDGDFNDANEAIGLLDDTTASPRTVTFTVPGSANLGNLRMRINMVSWYTPGACAVDNGNFGETEDYTVNIIQSPDPLAVDDNMAVAIDSGAGAANQIDVSANDDIGSEGGDANNYSINTLPTNGSLTEISDGVFEYIPNAGYLGNDSFVYELCDVSNDCTTATVSIIVNLGHCVPTSDSNGSHYITNFTLPGDTATINNTSGDDDGYASYLGVTPADLTKNGTYTGSITVNGGNMGWAIYIDYNQNGSFIDPGELVAETAGQGTGNLNFTVPNSVTLGTTVMRVGARRYYSSNVSCGNTASQPEEFEDYLVELKTDATTQDIQLSGNNNPIDDGAVTVSAANHTDFSIYDINSGALQRTFTILNDGVLDLTLTSPYVSITGSADFTVVNQPAVTLLVPGNSTTFDIAFDPSSVGVVTATVTVHSNDPDENPYTFVLEGEGARTFPDTDGDGVSDNVDIDDDNDGISDGDEINTCTSYSYASTTDLIFLNETFGAGLNRTQINGNYSGATTTYCYEDGTGSVCASAGNPSSVNDGDYTVHYTITNDDDVADGIDVDIATWAEDYWYAGLDHTPGDTNGRMAIFNATENPGVFYSQLISGATPNVPIQFGFYAINIDRDDIDATELATRERPNVIITIYDPNGDVITSVASGEIQPTSPAGDWVEVSASFTTNFSQFTVELSNANLGGLGNDLAIDDIFVKQTLCDLDGDGVADSIDLDNDNDGIPNVVELGLVDDNHDATVFNDATNPWTDTNNNGMHDAYESLIPRDTDNDGVPDYLDIDSDNDGIFDNVEYDGLGDIDISGDGVGEGNDYQDTVTDIKNDDPDGDGILSIMDDNDDDTDTVASLDHGTFSYPDPLDSDGDSIPDYLDVDSNDPTNNTADGSDIDTTVYAHLDADNDGEIDGSIDNDKDGLLSTFDTDDNTFGSPRDLDDSYSLFFDGRNDYVEDLANVVEGLSQVSQMAWIKLDNGFSTDGAVMGQTNFWVSVLANRRIQVNINGSQITTTEALPLGVWAHIAVIYDGLASGDTVKVYINGEEVTSDDTVSGTINSSAPSIVYRLGRKPFDTGSQYYFHGEIDEARVFGAALTEQELKRMVYQELSDAANFNQGSVIPKDISTSSVGGSLLRYFKMDGYKDDVTDDRVSATIDLAGARLYNIKKIFWQTAPLPFTTTDDGNWSDESTWAHGDVWDIESGSNAWSIVDISNEVTVSSTIENIGLVVSGQLSTNGDTAINNSWYLDLSGTIDLSGDSQIIQTHESDLVTNATGKILRRQEGTNNEYWYNYWASPVGALGASALIDNNGASNNANNSAFSLSMLTDDHGDPMEFTNAYDEAGRISRYWLYTYINGVTYFDFTNFDENDPLEPGVGYTQKGTGGVNSDYIFEGKPNNGTIQISVTDTGGAGSVPAVSRTNYLVGNPYPSALDIHGFIDDNAGVINGEIQLWQQWSGSSHILNEYNGGYATVNKVGSVRAYQFVGIEGANNGSQDGTLVPTRYLPVAQGFMVEIIADGTLEFNNSQRLFIRESDADGTYGNGSVFFRNGNTSTSNTSAQEEETLMQKIRLEFSTANSTESRRELLLGFSDDTSDDYDYGYDSKKASENATDLSLVLDDDLMLIQAYGPITTDKEVDLHLSIENTGNYSIKATDFVDFSEDQEVYLRDNLTGIYHDLTIDQGYSFISDSGVFPDRFDIVFQQHSTLGTDENELDKVTIYYENNTNLLFINGLKDRSLNSLSLYNTIGQKVFSLNSYQNNPADGISVPALSSGVYIVDISTLEGDKFNKKIIIK